MHPTISATLVKARQEQLRREADQWRLTRLARWRAGRRPALRGLLAKSATLGLELLSVRRTSPD